MAFANLTQASSWKVCNSSSAPTNGPSLPFSFPSIEGGTGVDVGVGGIGVDVAVGGMGEAVAVGGTSVAVGASGTCVASGAAQALKNSTVSIRLFICRGSL